MNITETDIIPAVRATQVYKAEFKTMPLSDIPKAIGYNEYWKPYGYNRAILWRPGGIVFLYR